MSYRAVPTKISHYFAQQRAGKRDQPKPISLCHFFNVFGWKDKKCSHDTASDRSEILHGGKYEHVVPLSAGPLSLLWFLRRQFHLPFGVFYYIKNKGGTTMPTVNKADLRRIQDLYIDHDYLEQTEQENTDGRSKEKKA